MKTCSKCHVAKTYAEYWVSRTGRTADGYKNECKDCAKARRNAWAAENREREREWNQAKYQAKRENYAHASRRWRQENRGRYLEIHRMSESARRARKRDTFIENVDPAVVYRMHGGMCGICEQFVSRDNFEVDHIMPLAKGGQHGYVNVQPAHPRCNRSKGAKIEC